MKILIMTPKWLGDSLFAQPLYRAIKRKYPWARLEAVVTPYTAELHRFIPELDHCYLSPIPAQSLSFSLRRRWGEAFRFGGYSRCYVLRHTLGDALIPLFARIPRRIGFLGQWRWKILNDIRRDPIRETPRLVDRYLSLVTPIEPLLQCPAEFVSLSTPTLHLPACEISPILDKLGIDRPVGRSWIALAPGSFARKDKRWPLSHFLQLVQQLLPQDLSLLLLGSTQDRPLVDALERELWLAGYLPKYRAQWCVIAGKASLQESLYLLQAVDLVVANDSGALHMAAALGTPVIGLYGPTSVAIAPPLTERHIALVANPEDLYHQPPSLSPTSGSHRSLQAISPARVQRAIATLLPTLSLRLTP